MGVTPPSVMGKPPTTPTPSQTNVSPALLPTDQLLSYAATVSNQTAVHLSEQEEAPSSPVRNDVP